MGNEIHVNYQTLCNKISQRLQQAGLSPERADVEAQIMAEADLLGVASHGVKRLPVLVAAIAAGNISAQPAEKVLREFGAIRVVDCGNGPGRYSALQAMQSAVQLASQLGVGVCLAKNTSHWGRAHAYASRAAIQGCIGICTTNAIPTMAAWGATSRVFGNNPLAIAVPGINPSEPVVLDIAMSQASVGKVATMLDQGVRPSHNLGFDAQGNASADPAAILKGAVSAMGMHKGQGLALMMELITAPLAGAMFNFEMLEKDASGIDPNASKLFVALNVAAFTSIDDYRSNIDKLFKQLKQTTPSFTYPGERGWQAKQRNITQGIPVSKGVADELIEIGVYL